MPQTQFFLISISVLPDGINLFYFKLTLFDLTKELKYQRSEISGNKVLGIRKSDFVGKTQFLLHVHITFFLNVSF